MPESEVAKENIKKILNKGGAKVANSKSKLVEYFFELSPEDKVKFFNGFEDGEDKFKFDDETKKTILVDNISKFKFNKQEELNAFTQCIYTTKAFKKFAIAMYGFSENGSPYEELEDIAQKKYVKKEYEYWLSLNPDERVLIYPFLKNKPSEIKLVVRGAGNLLHGALDVLIYILSKIVDKVMPSVSTIVSDLVSSTLEKSTDVENDYSDETRKFSDIKTFDRISQLPAVKGDAFNDLVSIVGEDELKTRASAGKEAVLRSEFLRLVRPGKVESRDNLYMLAQLFDFMVPTEQVKYFSVLQNHKVKFFLLGKGVIKNEAIKQCCSFLDGDKLDEKGKYVIGIEDATKDFYKSIYYNAGNKLSKDGKERSADGIQDVFVKRLGKKMFDLYKISHPTNIQTENLSNKNDKMNKLSNMPSASWERAKGKLKFLGKVAFIAVSIALLPFAGFVVASMFGAATIAAGVIGFGVACAASYAIDKLYGNDLKNKLNYDDNFKKAEQIDAINSEPNSEEIVKEEDIVKFHDDFKKDLEKMHDKHFQERSGSLYDLAINKDKLMSNQLVMAKTKIAQKTKNTKGKEETQIIDQ